MPDRACRLHLTVTPGASKSEVAGTQEGQLRVRVAAPAREGKANRELLAFLARSLQLAPSQLSLLRGEGSRHKVVVVNGLVQEEVLRRLGVDAV